MNRFIRAATGWIVLLGLAVWMAPNLEVTCYAILLGWLAGRKPFRVLLGQLSLPYQVFLLSFLLAVLAGQVINQETKTYPVVAWPMFTNPVAGDPDYFEYLGILPDGWEVELLVREELFPPPLGQNLMVQLARLARSIAGPRSGAANPQDVAHYEGLVRALAQKYNAMHPGQHVHAVDVWRCTVPVRNYLGPSSIRRERFRTVSAP
jgi:hypothetical protein